MRKTSALFIAVILIAVSLYVCVFASVNKEKENVVFREEYVYGDKEYIKNADVNLKLQYSDNILWDISYDIYKNNAETEFSLYRDRIPNPDFPTKHLMLTGSFWNYSSSGFLGEESFFEKPYKELVENAKPYEEAKKVISVSDYIDYYPLSIEISFSEKYNLDTSIGYYETGEKVLVDQLRSFFKIPVLKNHLLTISATVDENGNIFQSGSSSVASSEENSLYDEYSFYGQSVITDDKCLIYISNRTYMENTVDTSKIPGGYGIYCLPYSYSEDGKRVHFDGTKLENVFPVDDSNEIYELKLSKNQKYVYMITNEGEDNYLTVIDVETYEVIQRIKVSTFENQSTGLGYIEDNFAVLNHYHEYEKAYFSLYTIDESGLFTKEFTALTHLEEIDDGSDIIRYPGADIYENSNIDAEWDGKNLYVSNDFNVSDISYTHQNAGFSISVYNKDGLKFFGNYLSGLSSGYDGMYASSYNVFPSRYDKIDIILK